MKRVATTDGNQNQSTQNGASQSRAFVFDAPSAKRYFQLSQELSRDLLRLLAIISGGGAVALLGFVAAVLDESSPMKMKVVASVLPCLVALGRGALWAAIGLIFNEPASKNLSAQFALWERQPGRLWTWPTMAFLICGAIATICIVESIDNIHDAVRIGSEAASFAEALLLEKIQSLTTIQK